MIGFTLGKKVNQGQTYDQKGERVSTTFIETSSCYLIDIKTTDKNSYCALKLGFGKAKNIKNPVKGEQKKAGIKTPLRFLREFRVANDELIKTVEENNKKGIEIGSLKFFIGDEIKPNLFFKNGDLVDVSGVSKGKGFQGVVKRHHFAGGPKTHGQSDRLRGPGSIGSTTTPGRDYKGKRMAGRMGNQRVTIRNMIVIDVKENGLLVKGLIPGAKNGLIEIRKVDNK
jgi:large subunit ribosomal protein L3